MSNKIVKVGVGCMILKDGMVLLGKRKGAHGEGEYSWPGGHLEFGETIEQCVKREVKEETDLKVKAIKFLCVSNVIKYNLHYLDIEILTRYIRGKPKVLEPDRIESWEWYPLSKLPTPMFEMSKRALTAYKTGQYYFPK
jgi:8-oxo-dGTP diphosphatase